MGKKSKKKKKPQAVDTRSVVDQQSAVSSPPVKMKNKEYQQFLKGCPIFENFLVSNGIILLKYWLDVSEKIQHERFLARIKDPSKRWKLSPMDLESHRRWYDYSRARDAMLAATDTPFAPWYIVPSDDKKRARLNCIAHILKQIPYKDVPRSKVKLPKRWKKNRYDDQASLRGRKFVTEKY